jgi:hypothetical protein
MKKKYTKEEWHLLFSNKMLIYERPRVHIVYIGGEGKEISEHRWKSEVHKTLWKCNWKPFFLIPAPCYCYRLEGDYYVKNGFHLVGKCPRKGSLSSPY